MTQARLLSPIPSEPSFRLPVSVSRPLFAARRELQQLLDCAVKGT